MKNAAAPAWQDAIFQVLKRGGVKQVAYVPDAGHSHVIRSVIADPDIQDIVLTTEEEGVALSCGAWLGGQRAVVQNLIGRKEWVIIDGPFIKNRFRAALGLKPL